MKKQLSLSSSVYRRGISAPAPGAPPPPPSALTLVSVGLSLILFSLLCLTAVAQQFLPFLKYAITEALPKSLMGSAFGQQRIHLGASWHWLCCTWGHPLVSFHRSHPCHPPHATNSLPCKTNTWSHLPLNFTVQSIWTEKDFRIWHFLLLARSE